jgi:hypothetical protein
MGQALQAFLTLYNQSEDAWKPVRSGSAAIVGAAGDYSGYDRSRVVQAESPATGLGGSGKGDGTRGLGTVKLDVRALLVPAMQSVVPLDGSMSLESLRNFSISDFHAVDVLDKVGYVLDGERLQLVVDEKGSAARFSDLLFGEEETFDGWCFSGGAMHLPMRFGNLGEAEHVHELFPERLRGYCIDSFAMLFDPGERDRLEFTYGGTPILANVLENEWRHLLGVTDLRGYELIVADGQLRLIRSRTDKLMCVRSVFRAAVFNRFAAPTARVGSGPIDDGYCYTALYSDQVRSRMVYVLKKRPTGAHLAKWLQAAPAHWLYDGIVGLSVREKVCHVTRQPCTDDIVFSMPGEAEELARYVGSFDCVVGSRSRRCISVGTSIQDYCLPCVEAGVNHIRLCGSKFQDVGGFPVRELLPDLKYMNSSTTDPLTVFGVADFSYASDAGDVGADPGLVIPGFDQLPPDRSGAARVVVLDAVRFQRPSYGRALQVLLYPGYSYEVAGVSLSPMVPCVVVGFCGFDLRVVSGIGDHGPCVVTVKNLSCGAKLRYLHRRVGEDPAGTFFRFWRKSGLSLAMLYGKAAIGQVHVPKAVCKVEGMLGSDGGGYVALTRKVVHRARVLGDLGCSASGTAMLGHDSFGVVSYPGMPPGEERLQVADYGSAVVAAAGPVFTVQLGETVRLSSGQGCVFAPRMKDFRVVAIAPYTLLQGEDAYELDDGGLSPDVSDFEDEV